MHQLALYKNLSSDKTFERISIHHFYGPRALTIRFFLFKVEISTA